MPNVASVPNVQGGDFVNLGVSIFGWKGNGAVPSMPVNKFLGWKGNGAVPSMPVNKFFSWKGNGAVPSMPVNKL